MLASLLGLLARAQVILAVLLATAVLSGPKIDRIGDNVQIALPLLGLACAASSRTGAEYALRLAGMSLAAHGSKAALGRTEINLRPNGRPKGFPSAHTAAAAFGASSLVHTCLRSNPIAQALVIFAAGFVGGERLETGVHTLVQVMAGGLLGWWADRMLRRPSALRSRIATAFAGLGAWLRRLPGRPAPVQASESALAALLLLIFSAVATAQEREIEVSGYIGAQGALPGTLDFAGGPDFGVDWQGKPFAMPPYYGLRVTWWRDDRIGFAAEFNHAKVYADQATMTARGFDRLEFTDGLNFVTANILRRWKGQGRLTPYVGAGIGLSVPHVDVKPSGQAHTFGYQLTGPVVQAVAGATYALRGSWSAFGEVKATYSSHQVDLDSGQSFTTDLVTGAVNFGLGYRF